MAISIETRNERIIYLRRDGETITAIANRYGLTYARVYQICKALLPKREFNRINKETAYKRAA